MSRPATPLREYLDRHRLTISAFLARLAPHLDSLPSQPAVSQWASGRRVPLPHIQMAMMLATDGEVTPLDWARWSTSLRSHDDGSCCAVCKQRLPARSFSADC